MMIHEKWGKTRPGTKNLLINYYYFAGSIVFFFWCLYPAISPLMLDEFFLLTGREEAGKAQATREAARHRGQRTLP
jgi:hypothetical protein